MLAAVILSIIAANLFNLADHGVSLVGTLPRGFPPFTVPSVRLSDMGLLIGGALGIAVVSLADTISTASSFAARSGDEIDGNREMIGIGAANIAAGFFQGFPVSTSGSRTAVAEQSGARTQVTGLVGAVAITVILLAVPGLLRNLPAADPRGGRDRGRPVAGGHSRALFASSVSGGRSSPCRSRPFSVSACSACYRASPSRWPCRSATSSVSLWWPYQTTLGRVPGLAGYHDVRSYPQAEQLERCVILRFDAPLFFANARTFREQIQAVARSEPRPSWIIVAAEPITDIDTTAADMLEDLDQSLNASGISLVFAEMKDPVRSKVDRYGLNRTIDPAHFFPTLEEAITAFRNQSGASWAPAPSDPPR